MNNKFLQVLFTTLLLTDLTITTTIPHSEKWPGFSQNTQRKLRVGQLTPGRYKGLIFYFDEPLKSIQNEDHFVEQEEEYLRENIAKRLTLPNADNISTVEFDKTLSSLEIIGAVPIINDLHAMLINGTFTLTTQSGELISSRNVEEFFARNFQEILLTIYPYSKLRVTVPNLLLEARHMKAETEAQLDEEIEHVIVWTNRREISLLVERYLAQRIVDKLNVGGLFLTTVAGERLDIKQLPLRPIEFRDSTVKEAERLRLEFSLKAVYEQLSETEVAVNRLKKAGVLVERIDQGRVDSVVTGLG